MQQREKIMSELREKYKEYEEKHPKSYTNYDRIIDMSIDEMASYYATHLPKCCHMCIGMKTGCLREIDCTSGIKSWLESEAD